MVKIKIKMKQWFYDQYSWILRQIFTYKFKHGLLPKTDDFDFLRKDRYLNAYDDFEEGRLDRSLWNTSFPWGSIQEDLYKTTDGQNLEFANGVLKFLTKYEPGEEMTYDGLKSYIYTCGHLDTLGKYEQMYGRFEAKIKLSDKRGLWPAFWTLSVEEISNDFILPEIDIFEHEGNLDGDHRRLFFTYHWGKSYDSKDHKMNNGGLSTKLNFNDWFVYSIEWTKKSIKWYINDQCVKIMVSNLPDRPAFFILSESPTVDMINYLDILPYGMEVDWIRIYKNK